MMIKNVSQKILCMVLLITMLIVSTVSFAALPPEDNLQWTDIHTVVRSLSDNSTWLSKRLALYVCVDVYSNRYAGVTAQLQKLASDGVTWNDVSGKYWEDFPEDDEATIDENKISVSAGTYRAYVEYYAYSTNGLLLEYDDAYTNTVTIY